MVLGLDLLHKVKRHILSFYFNFQAGEENSLTNVSNKTEDPKQKKDEAGNIFTLFKPRYRRVLGRIAIVVLNR